MTGGVVEGDGGAEDEIAEVGRAEQVAGDEVPADAVDVSLKAGIKNRAEVKVDASGTPSKCRH